MTESQGPVYDLATLIHDCGQAGAVRVLGGSVKTARRDFGLSTEDAVREFIGNNGLELPSYIKTDPWANNPNPTQDVWVDVYSFYSGSLFGYLAFFRAPTGKWIIKSFKKNDRPDPRFLQIKAALERLKGGGQ